VTTSVRPLTRFAAPLERRIVLGAPAQRLLTIALLALAAATIAVSISVLWSPGVGVGFAPLRAAATALGQHRSVYADPLFGYPPTAAIAMLPFASGSPIAAFHVWVIVEIGALALGAALIARVRPAGERIGTAAILATVLVGSAVASDGLPLGNLSPILVPFAVYTLLSFERGNWARGCVVLVISLLLEPVLVPLLFLPVVRRQWRALAWSVGPGVVSLGLAGGLVPGAGQLSRVGGFLAGHANLHGQNAASNLSLPGWGEYNQQPLLAVAAAATIAALGGYALVRWTRRQSGGEYAVQIGTALLLTVFLAGRTAEVDFLMTIMATTLLAVMLRPDQNSAPFLVGAFALLVLPHQYLGGLADPGAPLQACYVVAELLVLLAVLRPVFTRP
jgi:arabinofuranan 3-O-arabinosyltransferase